MAHPNDDPETAPTRRYESSDEDDDLGGVEAGAFGSAASGSSAAVLAEVADDDGFDPDGPTIGQGRGPITRATPAERDASSAETILLENETMAEINAQAVSRRLGGDFELQKKIGQGGMGEVWLARQISLDRKVAVKVLPRALATQPNFIERFQQEARAAARLVHPNVLQIYAYGIDEGTPFFAMEYVKGLDLQQQMKKAKQPLEIHEVVGIMLGVAAALQAAHDMGVIHRDIKPSNIMTDERTGLVKVMDFGLAKAITSGGDKDKSITSAGLIMGTPNYLSPEQGRGEKLDGRSDLYSAGIVLYELLTGQLPFRADTPAGLIFKHVYEPPPPPQALRPGLPPFLIEITLRLLAKDPDDRYASGQELLADLTEFIDNMDHYAAGGERIPGSGYQDAQRVANSGSVASTEKAKRRLSAISSGRLRKLELSPPPELDDDDLADEHATTDVLEPEPPIESWDEARPDPSTERVPKPAFGARRRRREEPETRSEPRRGPRRLRRALVGLAALLAAALGVYAARPAWIPADVYARLDPVRDQALAAYDGWAATTPWLPRRSPAPSPSVEPSPSPSPSVAPSPSPSAEPSPSPSAEPSPSPSVEPSVVDPAPSPTSEPALALLLDVPALPPGTQLELRGEGGAEHAWRAGESARAPAGAYTLTLRRPGYRPVELAALVAADAEAGGGALRGADGQALAPSWTPTPALTGAYQQARAALDASDAVAAAIALDEAAQLDLDYAPTGLPSVRALRDELTALQRKQAESQDQLTALLARVEELVAAKRWRAALRNLEGLRAKRPDDAQRLELRCQQGIEDGAAAREQVEGAVARGDFAVADASLERLEAIDPQHPGREDLSQRVQQARTRRAAALRATEVAAALGLLEAYAREVGTRDQAVAQRLDELRAEQARLAALRAEEQALRDLQRAGRWSEAKHKAEAILASAPKHPLATEVLAEALDQLHREAIGAACAELDRALESGQLAVLVGLLDRESPAFETETRVFRRFTSDAVRGRFVRSQHALEPASITFSRVPGSDRLTARVRASWRFTVAVLGMEPRELTRTHELSLRLADDRWRFVGFGLGKE